MWPLWNNHMIKNLGNNEMMVQSVTKPACINMVQHAALLFGGGYACSSPLWLHICLPPNQAREKPGAFLW